VSSDGREVLFETLDSVDQMWICSAGNPRRALIEWEGKPALRLSAARFSPNGKWVAFSGSPFGSSVKDLWIVPLRKDRPAKENELIQFTNGDFAETEPYWSPDGRTIYFLSDRDGFLCIWARSFDPVTGQPRNAEFPVSHFHQATRSIQSPSPYRGDIGLSVAKDSLVLMLADRHSNIWRQAEPKSAR
jgi:dipeptidyl aminopeptidase/acylaminoacyl peptidase